MSVPLASASEAKAPPPPVLTEEVLTRVALRVDYLVGVIVFRTDDVRPCLSYSRKDGGLDEKMVAGALRESFRHAEAVAERLSLAQPAQASDPPVVAIELRSRIVLLRRARSEVVACIFEGTTPLGMARLFAARISDEVGKHVLAVDDESQPAPQTPPRPFAARRDSLLPRRSTDGDRMRKLVAFLEERSPEPHVVRHRLALRAGITLEALGNADTLGPEAMVLIETAAQDILGLDRSELGRIP